MNRAKAPPTPMPNHLDRRTNFAILAVGVLFFHAPPASAQNPPVTITVDANANRRPIDPNIYGVAHATTAELTDLNSPLNRHGGNTTTRYNWQLNADNRGDDWYFQSIAESSADAPASAATRSSPTRARPSRADADDPDDRLGRQARPEPHASSPASRSPSTARRPATTGSGFPTPATACARTASSSPATIRTTPTCRRHRSSSRAGSSTSSAAGARPRTAACATTSSTTSRASGTRRTATCARPAPTMDEIRDKMIDLRARIKAVDPAALVVGPEEWGWSGYFYSGYDQQWGSTHGWGSLPDRAGHGGGDYLPGCSTRCASASTTRPAPARRLHRALLSAGRRVRRRRLERDAAAAQPLDALAVGSELRRRDLDQRPRAAHPAAEELGQHATTPARRSASPNTTGAPRATSTARPRRPTSSASSAARGSTWPRAGRRPRPARRPTRR